jgi:hypothetical protein
MVALANQRGIQQAGGGGLLALAVTAAVVCYGGGMAMMSAGAVRPARSGQGADDFLKMADAGASRVVGVFLANFTGGAADGDVVADVQSDEAFLVANSAGVDAVTASHIGRYCYVVDDQTVACNSAGFTRPAAGIVRAVESGGVLVEMGPEISARAPAAVALPFFINQVDTLAGTAAELISPVKGAIARMLTTVQIAPTTGGDVTATVGVTAVNGLTITVADAAAKGTIQTDQPTAGHASTLVNPGDRITVVPAAAFATAGAISGVVLIER